MLRTLVLILLLVNATFFAWSQGWLNRVVGVQPDAQHEPLRLAHQFKPDQLVLVPPGSAASASAPRPASGPVSSSAPASATSAPATASAPSPPPSSTAAASAVPGGVCIEGGPFNASEYPPVARTLQALLPAGSWRSDTVAVQGLWMAYMGPYEDEDALARKQAELARLKGLTVDTVKTPASLAPGLSLGRYTDQAEAETALTAFKQRGIRSARIVRLRAAADLQIVRVPQATKGMQATLASIKLPAGKGFAACRP